MLAFSMSLGMKKVLRVAISFGSCEVEGVGKMQHVTGIVLRQGLGAILLPSPLSSSVFSSSPSPPFSVG